MPSTDNAATYAVPKADTILTAEQVGAWLQIKTRQVQRLGIPALRLAHKTVRYRAADVTAWLMAQSRAA